MATGLETYIALKKAADRRRSCSSCELRINELEARELRKLSPEDLLCDPEKAVEVVADLQRGNLHSLGSLLGIRLVTELDAPSLLPLPNSLDALKLLADWSKWCVLIETGVIAAIGAFLQPELLGKATSGPRGFLTATIVLFGLSIICAAGLLLSIPATAQRLPPPHPKDVFLMGTFEGTRGVRVSIAVHVQTWTFIAGLVCFAIAVIMLCWQLHAPEVKPGFFESIGDWLRKSN
jgi:hypothetical protein